MATTVTIKITVAQLDNLRAVLKRERTYIEVASKNPKMSKEERVEAGRIAFQIDELERVLS